jgi:hypothetical protein
MAESGRQRAQRKSSGLRLKADLQSRSGEQTEILARHPVALGNTGVTKMLWLTVAPCGEVRHSKMKNIDAANTSGCRLWRGVASNQKNESES